MESSAYYKTKQAFDAEACKQDGIFSKQLTDCDRLAIEFLNQYLQDWMQVLEIGCGMCNVLENVKGNRRGIDLSPEMLKGCNIGNVTEGNMDDLPYPENTFDATYMIMTLQHSKNIQKTLEEMKRVTKEGGWMFIIDGDKDSGIGKLREEGIKDGSWYRVGEAKWLNRDDFPEWESKHLAEHILCLYRRKDDDWTICDEAMGIILDYIEKEKPKVIVEIGSGISTKTIAQNLPTESTFFSCEPKQEWFKRTERLTKGLPVTLLNEQYPNIPEINLLIIDGPEGESGKLKRLPPKEVLNKVKGTVFLHDTKRQEEQIIANLIGRATFYETKWGIAKINLC